MTAKDLLYKMLDYQYVWSLPENKKSKPARVRLAQIESMLDAFGLSKTHVNPLVQIKYSIIGETNKLDRARRLNSLSNIEYVLIGEFINDREYALNQELITRAFSTITEIYPDLPESILERPISISWMFDNLINFRQEIYKIMYPHGGMLEGFSIGLQYSFYLQDKLKQIITDNLHEIDETLWLILDPTKREIELTELERRYNFVNHDLDAIDLEWRMENY